MSSVKTLEETKNVPGCFYMRMPVEAYGTLEFGKFTEISQIGYQAASKFLDEWTAQGVLPTGIEGGAEGDPAQRRSRGKAARRNSI